MRNRLVAAAFMVASLLICAVVTEGSASGKAASGQALTSERKQENAVPKRPSPPSVVVNLTDADPVTGRFVRADAEVVVVDLGAGEITIKTAKVVSILFEGATATAGKVEKTEDSKETIAIEKIISALRRLDNAVAVGVTFQNYSSLLIENKSAVDDNLKDVSSQAFRTEVEQALTDYQYAMSIWNAAVANNWSYFLSRQEPGRTLITKYGVPIKVGIFNSVPVMTGLNYVWLSARGHFNRAAGIANIKL